MKKVLFFILIMFATYAKAQYMGNGVYYFPPLQFPSHEEMAKRIIEANGGPQKVAQDIDARIKSNNYQSNTTNNNRSGQSHPQSTTSTRQKFPCTICNQTGKEIKEMYLGGNAKDKWCGTCNRKVSAGHYHGTCSYCKGKGYTY